VPGRCSIQDNERADCLGQLASSLSFIGLEPVLTVTYASAKLALRGWVRQLADTYWERFTAYRQSKIVIKGRCEKKG